MASNDDIMLALGKLQEGVDRLRSDFQEEKHMAHESRAVIHQRLDSQVQQIAHMETTIAIAGEIDAQIRGQLKGLKETVEKNNEDVAPSVADWKRMKALGLGIVGLIGLGGMTVGGILYAAGDAAANFIRAWLKIS